MVDPWLIYTTIKISRVYKISIEDRASPWPSKQYQYCLILLIYLLIMIAEDRIMMLTLIKEKLTFGLIDIGY